LPLAISRGVFYTARIEGISVQKRVKARGRPTREDRLAGLEVLAPDRAVRVRQRIYAGRHERQAEAIAAVVPHPHRDAVMTAAAAVLRQRLPRDRPKSSKAITAFRAFVEQYATPPTRDAWPDDYTQSLAGTWLLCGRPRGTRNGAMDSAVAHWRANAGPELSARALWYRIKLALQRLRQDFPDMGAILDLPYEARHASRREARELRGR